MVYKIIVFASGRGSDFQSIIDANRLGKINVTIVGMITDNPQAYAIERARAAGIPSFVIEPKNYQTREDFDQAIFEKVEVLKPHLIVLAGYMKIIKNRKVLSEYRGKIINIHPSLLPKFPGAHAQADAFEAGEKISGFTIHFVDDSLDGGPIIYQEKIDISDCKSADEVSAKILQREHLGLPMVVGWFSQGKVNFTDEGKVEVD